MDLIGPEFDETSGSKVAIAFNPAYADLLLRGSGHTFAELAALGKERKPLPHFALKVSLRATTDARSRDVDSTNIVSRIPGTDRTPNAEYVVLSSHLDHVGSGKPSNGDRIYNGAMDNGSGSALLLDIARTFQQ